MRRTFLLCITLCLGSGVAQAPEAAADAAVSDWLSQEPFDARSVQQQLLAGGSVEDVCTELGGFLSAPPPPRDLEVNLADQQLTREEDELLVYSYPAGTDSGFLSIVEVQLSRAEDSWEAERVGLRQAGTGGVEAMTRTVQSPVSYILFSLFSLGLLLLSLRPSSVLRRTLYEAWGYLKEHRGAALFSLAFFYGSFVGGYTTGTTLPAACGQALQDYLVQSLDSLGILDAVISNNTPRLATAIFFQNFTFGAFFTTFVPAALLAVPAFLFNGPRLFFLAMFIGERGLGDPVSATLSIILYVVELAAYALVAAGGAMMLVTLVREGFGGLGKGYRKLLLMLPVALVILAIGAWYEAVIIHLAS